jgi:hypothetical protein
VLTDRLRQAFEGQIRKLPAETQALLLVAAADGRGDIGVLLDAAAMLGVNATDSESAEKAGLIVLCQPADEVPSSAARAVYQARR